MTEYQGVSSAPFHIIVRNGSGAEVRRIRFNSTAQLANIMPTEAHLLPGFWFDYSECQDAVGDIEDYQKRLEEEQQAKKRRKASGRQGRINV